MGKGFKHTHFCPWGESVKVVRVEDVPTAPNPHGVDARCFIARSTSRWST